ncbi:MAG TPA: hypothetical protein VNG73_11175, partial [Gemmatimonadaceae bacterium]|nr:hypothetical protein [Gemmatimonadaceae bacterium]
MKKMPESVNDPEIAAISLVYDALKDLASDAQSRVLAYVTGKLKLGTLNSNKQSEVDGFAASTEKGHRAAATDEQVDTEAAEEDPDGISPIAKKWMKRNGLSATQLDKIFSLGVNEIDLIATAVPGKGKKEKMRSVFLL